MGGRESGANFRGRQWEREEEERLRKVAELEWAEANEQLPWYKRKTETVENPDYDGSGRWVEDEDGNETWEEDESPTMEVSPMAKFRNEVSTTSRAPRRRLKKPAGTKVQVEREGKTKLASTAPRSGSGPSPWCGIASSRSGPSRRLRARGSCSRRSAFPSGSWAAGW